jgi:DNA-binding ferritin-like protein
MARESFAFPESRMAEIIEVLRAGLEHLGDAVSQDTADLIEDWCTDSEDYAEEFDRRRT